MVYFSRAVTKKENPEPYISFLPMFHIFGLAAVCSTSHCMGYKVVFMSKFNAEEYLSLIQTYRVSLTQQAHGVKTASYRRQCDVMTSHRR